MYHLGQEAFPLSNTEWAPCVRLTAQMTSRVGKQIHCFKPISIKKSYRFLSTGAITFDKYYSQGKCQLNLWQVKKYV